MPIETKAMPGAPGGVIADATRTEVKRQLALPGVKAVYWVIGTDPVSGDPVDILFIERADDPAPNDEPVTEAQ